MGTGGGVAGFVSVGGRRPVGGRGNTAGGSGAFAGGGGTRAGFGMGGAAMGRCGDGIVDAGEECDDGNQNNQDDCTSFCKNARCGDGVIWKGHETCDNGDARSGDGCTSVCRVEARDLSAGDATSCALGYNGALKCWGNGLTGALGQGNTRNIGDQPGELGAALAPIDLNSDPNVFLIAAGAQHTCIGTLDGVRCWGYNGDGELGLGDTQNRGDDPGEMGNALPFVDLGHDFFPTALAAGSSSSCAVNTYSTLKCWGANLAGELGLGDTANRGDGPGEMGNALPFVDLGTGVKVTGVTVGNTHACALLDTGQVKCWGANDWGQLGLGDAEARGNQPGQMGDALPFVDLGSGDRATKVLAAEGRTCALLERQALKCWGENSTGTLGLGDFMNRGNLPGQMGDALPTVDIGTGRSVKDFALGVFHTCALLDDGSVKCWGLNNAGQLGIPGTIDRGGSPEDMGDNLPRTDLDEGVQRIAAGGQHTCVKLQNLGVVKCWGANDSGELGLGDTNTRGDDAGEMGVNLPAVDVDF
jgi:cysteine-rich repeat protein